MVLPATTASRATRPSPETASPGRKPGGSKEHLTPDAPRAKGTPMNPWKDSGGLGSPPSTEHDQPLTAGTANKGVPVLPAGSVAALGLAPAPTPPSPRGPAPPL